MSWALEGVVQLDRSGPPPRVCLDTAPVQVLPVTWDDILGCWYLSMELDELAHRLGASCTTLVVELLVVRYRGPFLRVPGEDSFWPRVERYGLALASVAAVDQRDARARRRQLSLAMNTPSHERGSEGTKWTRTRRKGHK